MLKQAQRQLAIPRQPDPVDPRPTLAEWLVTYRTIIGQRGYKAQTINNRTTSLTCIECVWGERPLRPIKPHEIATKLKLCAPHKAGRTLGELRDVYVEAIANGQAETSPAAHVKPPRARGVLVSGAASRAVAHQPAIRRRSAALQRCRAPELR